MEGDIIYYTATGLKFNNFYKMFAFLRRMSTKYLFVCVEVLRASQPNGVMSSAVSFNPMGSCRARSVYLTTRLLGRLSPLSG